MIGTIYMGVGMVLAFGVNIWAFTSERVATEDVPELLTRGLFVAAIWPVLAAGLVLEGLVGFARWARSTP